MSHSSIRTAHRWEGGEAYPDVDQVQKLARAVFSADVQLAADLAQAAGTTLQAMGLVPPPRAPVDTSPPATAPRAFPPVALMVDSILLAAVDAVEGQAATSATRQTVRDVLRAGFSRARGLGLTIEEVDDALAPPPAARPAPAKK